MWEHCRIASRNPHPRCHLLPQGEKEETSVHGIGLTGSRGQEITFRKFFSVFFGVAAMRVS
jgi:hypothetical protein